MGQTLIKNCKNWSDFQTRLVVLTSNRKGDAFEDLDALSFQITPKDKTKYKKIWKLPADIPAGPSRIYKDKGWKGTRDWLGTNADE